MPLPLKTTANAGGHTQWQEKEDRSILNNLERSQSALPIPPLLLKPNFSFLLGVCDCVCVLKHRQNLAVFRCHIWTESKV